MTDARDLAARLREDPPRLDDLTRARIERRLLEASETPVLGLEGTPRPSRPSFGMGVGVGLAIAALAVVLWSRRDELGESRPPSAAMTFEALRDGVVVRRGPFGEGEAVETSDGQLVRVAVAGPGQRPRALVAVAPKSRVRFERVRPPAVRLFLERGRARVEFHPERRGEETLEVRTPTALVEVVGTVFEVVVEGRVTVVEVTEGVVRVTPLEGGEAVLVRAGQAHTVGADEGARDQAAPDLPQQVEQAASDLPQQAEVSAGGRAAGGAEGRGSSNRDRVVRAEAGEPGGGAQARASSDAAGESVGREAGTDGAEAELRTQQGVPLSDDVRFDLAARYFEQGRWEESRHELYAIVRTSDSSLSKTRAWIEVAETFERQGDFGRAAEAYRRAAAAGASTTLGANALFALGRLRARLGEVRAARAAYRRYLQDAPRGPLAAQAARALCELGEARWCAEIAGEAP